MNDESTTFLTILLATAVIVIAIALLIIVIAALAVGITYIFEHWLTWCKVNYQLLRTGLVLIGFATPIIIYHAQKGE